jgi:hypothetical protein
MYISPALLILHLIRRFSPSPVLQNYVSVLNHTPSLEEEILMLLRLFAFMWDLPNSIFLQSIWTAPQTRRLRVRFPVVSLKVSLT